LVSPLVVGIRHSVLLITGRVKEAGAKRSSALW
jgi:hypothetical protein